MVSEELVQEYSNVLSRLGCQATTLAWNLVSSPFSRNISVKTNC